MQDDDAEYAWDELRFFISTQWCDTAADVSRPYEGWLQCVTIGTW